MGRKKHIKIKETATFPNVFRINEETTEKDFLKYFGNNNPVVLEVGCGHGDYSVNLALQYPESNFIGLDIKPARIHRGASRALDESINNLAFLVGRAEKLAEVFKAHPINAIWIPFPDPHPRRKSASRRLISPEFLNIYREILSENGVVNFKTDNEGLFKYAKEVLNNQDVTIHKLTDNLYESDFHELTHEIQTTYEKRYLEEGRIIRFVSFSFNHNPDKGKDQIKN